MTNMARARPETSLQARVSSGPLHGYKDLSICSILNYFPLHVSRKLDRNRTSWNPTRTHMECQQVRQQLKLLCHSASPTSWLPQTCWIVLSYFTPKLFSISPQRLLVPSCPPKTIPVLCSVNVASISFISTFTHWRFFSENEKKEPANIKCIVY